MLIRAGKDCFLKMSVFATKLVFALLQKTYYIGSLVVQNGASWEAGRAITQSPATRRKSFFLQVSRISAAELWGTSSGISGRRKVVGNGLRMGRYSNMKRRDEDSTYSPFAQNRIQKACIHLFLPVQHLRLGKISFRSALILSKTWYSEASLRNTGACYSSK